MNPAEETYLDMAESFEAKGNYEKALVWYKKIQGNGDVYEIIGEYLYLGRGCGKDEREAKKYFKKAAEAGNTDALCNIALCEKDLEKKLELYKKSAELGNAYAMNMVGIIQEDMENSDSSQIIQWFKRAADAGSEIGCFNYAMNIDNSNEKIKYLTMAAKKDCIEALDKLSEYLSKGTYGIKDLEKAKVMRVRITQLLLKKKITEIKERKE